MATFIIGSILLVVVVLVIIYLIQSKKKGKSTCGGNCMSCPMSGKCGEKSNKTK